MWRNEGALKQCWWESKNGATIFREQYTVSYKGKHYTYHMIQKFPQKLLHDDYSNFTLNKPKLYNNPVAIK